MKKMWLRSILTGFLMVGMSSILTAAPGDTTIVTAKDTIHWSGFGGYFTAADFPDNDKTYQRIWLKATLGCPAKGCSQWDYTTKFAVYDSSGKETYLPDFKANGKILDTLSYTNKPVYRYIYSGGNIVDSTKITPTELKFYNKSPQEEIRTEEVWSVSEPIKDVNQQGDTINSHTVSPDETLVNQVDTIYGEPIEIGRAATPYSGRKEKGWTYPWLFDVTDYQKILKGKQRLRAFYRGPRDGFTIKLKFIMIEGTPPREPLTVQNIYKSPARGWYYSFDTSDINNDRLVQKDFTMPENAKEAKVRVSMKGHGFGERGANCSEFCRKWYKVFVNGDKVGQSIPWRNDCDMTPVYPQTGTWIFSRSNWCPGTESYPSDFEITKKVTPGQQFSTEMEIEDHQFELPVYNRDLDGDGDSPDTNNYTDPRWVIDAQVITYGEKNFDRDVAITRIIAPNNQANQSRFNPTCGNPIVVIENRGANPLTSANLKYGGKNGFRKQYKWEGNLQFMERDTVILPSSGKWSPLYENSRTFVVEVSNPNGASDEYKHNNLARSQFDAVNRFPQRFRFRLRTNNRPSETSYILKRKWGDTVRYRTSFDANTVYIDTFDLSPGCYEFILMDKASGEVGDGLSFFANNENNGSARFIEYQSQLPLENGLMEANFGRQVRRSFTVGYQVGAEDQARAQRSFSIRPNPVESRQLRADLELPRTQDIQVTVYNAKGQRMAQKAISGYQSGGFQINVSNLKEGFYLMQVQAGKNQYTKRFIRQ